MTELVFLKLGGSLITDKTRPYTARLEKIAELAQEIRAALQRMPELRLVLGHGSGSFGHYAVKEHWSSPPAHLPLGEGQKDEGFWHGYSEVWYRASQLNRYLIDALHTTTIPCVDFPASGSVIAENGHVKSWDISPIRTALQKNIVPVIHGDVVFDEHLGGVVLSTEVIMSYLVQHLKPTRILLAGLEEAVWSNFPDRRQKVARLTPDSYEALVNQLGGSHGTDVTGGMKSKVEQMLTLVRQAPEVNVQIFSGEKKGNIEKALAGEHLGTLITCD